MYASVFACLVIIVTLEYRFGDQKMCVDSGLWLYAVKPQRIMSQPASVVICRKCCGRCQIAELLLFEFAGYILICIIASMRQSVTAAA